MVLFATLGLSFGADQLILKKPPASLGKYYPSQSNKFECVSVMQEMSTAFYKDAYMRAQNMVPEWKDYFKPALADQLINAVRAKNPDQVIKASRELGDNCTKCHAENQIAVKLVYHYPPFATLKMEDPVEFDQQGIHEKALGFHESPEDLPHSG